MKKKAHKIMFRSFGQWHRESGLLENIIKIYVNHSWVCCRENIGDAQFLHQVALPLATLSEMISSIYGHFLGSSPVGMFLNIMLFDEYSFLISSFQKRK